MLMTCVYVKGKITVIYTSVEKIINNTVTYVILSSNHYNQPARCICVCVWGGGVYVLCIHVPYCCMYIPVVHPIRQ